MIATIPAQFNSTRFKPHDRLLTEFALQKEQELANKTGKAKIFGKLLQHLPDIVPSTLQLDDRHVRIGIATDLTRDAKMRLDTALAGLHPWRKGPFDVFGTQIDCEWRSDLKWDRIKDRIEPLQDRKILDIGSSSGYYLFRMLPHMPRCAIGLEPYLTFYYQFLALQHYIRASHVHCLPLRFADFPILAEFFDTIFCMGILYHSRAPLDMLSRIRKYISKKGELVLETLIIEGDADQALCPYPRYAKMHNAYFLPTVPCLTGWLRRTGFTDIRCVDVTRITEREQRKTDWMTFESLTDFLDPADPSRTIEGYPAPVRAILLARPR